MYMRLWWKDARQFWPIWAFLVLVAAAADVLLVQYASDDVRESALGPMAIGWAGLYAFAVGAAAFAGERETGTLRLLDMLPASRRIVWAGKVSFGLVTTAAMMVVLVLLAMLGKSQPAGLLRIGTGGDPLPLAVLILQGLAWGLLFSSVLNSAMVAAIASIVMTTIVGYTMADRYTDPSQGMVLNLGFALALLAASLIAFAWSRRGRLWTIGLELRSPVVVTGVGSGSSRAAGRRPAAMDQPPAEMSPIAAAVAGLPAAAPGRVIASAAWSADRARPRSAFTELRWLSRETMREGRRIWLVLLLLAVYTTVVLASDPRFAQREGAVVVLGLGVIALVGGVSVFGLESQRRTYRFLVHHGARPGLVWLAKLATWLFGVALLLAPGLVAMGQQSPPRPGAESLWLLFAINLSLVFAVGMICGMAIPRGITAWTVALVLALVLAGMQAGLMAAGMIPFWGMAVLPAALVLVSWTWRGDWMLERPAPGRWVRLGLLASAMFAALFGGLTGWRAWSVPDVGPIDPPAAWTAMSTPLPPDRNAAELYREAGRIAEMHGARSGPVATRKPLDLDRYPEALDLIRRAVARPECRFVAPTRLTMRDRYDIPPMRELADAVAQHGRVRIDRGDLAGGWDDVMLILRMGRQVGQGALAWESLMALAVERAGLNLAIDWANAKGQAPDRLRGAMAAYLALPRMIPAAEIIRAEGVLVERTIDLPREDLRDFLAAYLTEGSGRPPRIEMMLAIDLMTMPWERTRARRLNRLMTAEALRFAALEPWRRPMGSGRIEVYFKGEADRFSLLRMLQYNFFGSYLSVEDQNEVVRRALVQVMAMRDWVLRHDGKFPAKLEDLVPSELPALPVDVFTGQPFGYTTYARSMELRVQGRSPDWKGPDWPPETRLIYSAGTDNRDDHGAFLTPGRADISDIVFPVQPVATK